MMIMSQLMTNVVRVLMKVVMKEKKLSKRKKYIKKKTVIKIKPSPTKQKKKQQKDCKTVNCFYIFYSSKSFRICCINYCKKWEKMQCQMSVTPQPLGLNPLKDMAQVDEIDYSADFDNLYSRIDDFNKFTKTGKISYNMLKYIPGLAKVAYQGQLRSTETERKYVENSCRNKKVIEFNVQLTANHYTNFQNVHLCFPIKIKSAADNDNGITAGTIPVNNLYAHWIKETDIKTYGGDMPILPLTNKIDINRYSDELLKHMSKDALKTIENDLLYSKDKVAIYGNDKDRRVHYRTTNSTVGNRTDENVTDRIAKFQDQIKDEYIYRIPLKYLCVVGLVNQCFKFNTKYILALETDMQRLFETNTNEATDALPDSVDANIVVTGTPYIM